MRETDVILLGAGIASSIAAYILRTKGYRVTIISRDQGTQYHLPESWIYSIKSLKKLGLENKVGSSIKNDNKCSFFSANGSVKLQISTKDYSNEIQEGDLVRVDRNIFDQILLKNALEEGASLIGSSRILDCQINFNEITVFVDTQEGHQEIKSQYIIDGTGKSAFLSQHLNLPNKQAKLDSRVAYFTHYESDTPIISEGISIIAIESGYLFCIPITDRRMSIGCVIAEHSINPQETPDSIYANAIAKSSLVSRLIENAKQVLPIIITAKNQSSICLKPAGDRYRVIGDAAAFLDPFFCPGIDFAFFSAELAVQTIIENNPVLYQESLMNWLKIENRSVYEKMEQVSWRAIVRLFADPHLPIVVPLFLTQAFSQIVNRETSLYEGIQIAREAYAKAN